MKKRPSVSRIFKSVAFALVIPGSFAQAASVTDAVRAALESNPRVLAGFDEVMIREQERNAARSGYFPSLDLAATYGREYTNRPATRVTHGDEFIDYDTQAVGLELRQNLFSGFETTRLVEQQDARIKSAHGDLSDTREQVALDAANAYLRVLRESQILHMAKVFHAAHQSIYDKINARSSAGVSKKADLDQAEGRLALARSNVIAAEANLRDAKASYLRVIGQAAPADMSTPAALDATMPVNIDAALQAAAEANPALSAANADVDAAQAGRGAAKGAFYPSLDLVLARNWNKDVAGIEGDDENYGAYLQMRYNLLSGGGDTAQEKAAANRLAQAKNRRDDVQRQVSESMRLAWNAYEAVNQQLGYLRAHEKASERTRNAYSKQFSIGQRTLLDLLDTENELFEARRDVVRAEFDRLSAQYRIQALAGKLQSLLLSVR